MHVGWNWYGKRTLSVKLLVLMGLLAIFALIIVVGFLRPSIAAQTQPDGPYGWRAELYTPTTIVKIDDKWFIVDCWHNRVLWTHDVSTPVRNWGILSDNLAEPHSIVKFGDYYVVEDTGRNTVKFFTFNGNNFAEAHALHDIGKRPHRLQVTSEGLGLFVLSANDQRISKIVLDSGIPKVSWSSQPNFLKGKYVRSFTILKDGVFLFAPEDGYILSAKLRDTFFERINSYSLPKGAKSTCDIFFDENNFIVTTWGGDIYLSSSLEGLKLSSTRRSSTSLGLKGSPYFVSKVDGEIYIPEIDSYSRIGKYVIKGDEIKLKGILFDSGRPSEESMKEKDRFRRQLLGHSI